MLDRNDEHRRVTRDELKEILRVNFELYKDEPDFFDYLTTLVIYMMEYEYTSDDKPAPAAEHKRVAGIETFSPLHKKNLVTEGRCPNCNNTVGADKRICPFCLALVQH